MMYDLVTKLYSDGNRKIVLYRKLYSYWFFTVCCQLECCMAGTFKCKLHLIPSCHKAVRQPKLHQPHSNVKPGPVL